MSSRTLADAQHASADGATLQAKPLDPMFRGTVRNSVACTAIRQCGRLVSRKAQAVGTTEWQLAI